MAIRIEPDAEAIRQFCSHWKVTEFSLFGSVLRDDFGPDSDVDVLVSFAPDAHRACSISWPWRRSWRLSSAARSTSWRRLGCATPSAAKRSCHRGE